MSHVVRIEQSQFVLLVTYDGNRVVLVIKGANKNDQEFSFLLSINIHTNMCLVSLLFSIKFTVTAVNVSSEMMYTVMVHSKTNKIKS